MAKAIMSHRVTRGTLVHQVQDVQFPQFKQAICAASAAHALRDLQAQRPRRRDRTGIPLTMEDQLVLQRVGTRQEREYRRADSDDAAITRMRLRRGGCGIAKIVARIIRASVQS